MTTFTVTWTDGHVETIEANTYQQVEDSFVFYGGGGSGKPVATVPHAGVRLVRCAGKGV